MISIDPGKLGGIAWTDDDGIVRAEPMPEGMTEIADFFMHIPFKSVVVMEKVNGYVPGNSGASACKFSEHKGHLEAILYCLNFPLEEVSPAKWMKPFNLPKDKAERKKAIKEQMARLYPHLTVTLKTADALGILTWAMRDLGR
jgi:hypothetical protein